MSKYLRYGLFGAVASIAAVYFITQEIDLEQFRLAWQHARYVYAIPCILLLFLSLFTRGVRWRVLLSNGLPLHRAVSILNVSYLINGFVPFRLGEVVRAYMASRVVPPVPFFKSAATIIVERLLDLLTVVILIAIALAAGPVPDWLRGAALGSAIVTLIGFFGLIFFASQRDLAHKFLALSLRLLPALKRLNMTAWLDHFLDGLLPLTKLRTLMLALLWTAISWGISVGTGYIAMFMFYDKGSWVATCLYIAASSLAVAVPAVPGSVGTFEFAIILALGAVGFSDQNVATAFALTIHMANVIVYAVAGIIGFIQEGVSVGQLSRGVRQITETSEANPA
ncbi:MAG: flippase-like domain-containing protein [Chitinophagaceae bacterium]|nr:flippase-like domain-containing protein [Anaerolineae bacterium]